jgi:tripartite ATP-independent transporter DctM subunit
MKEVQVLLSLDVWICFGVFVVLLLIEVPISFSMLGSSMLYAFLNQESFVMFAQKISSSFADFSMLAVPAFLFVGIFMNEIGLTDRIFKAAEKWLGHIPGGLAHANVLASMIFAGMSGSALADAGGLGTIEVKAMRDSGYDEYFSVAITAASSTIGPIIPPSINLVIWGFLSSTSTLTLFLAGLVPGILMGLAMIIWIVFAVKSFNIKTPPLVKSSWKDRWFYTLQAFPALGGPIILIGGILSGVFTPTECGVVAGAYCVLLAAIYKKLNLTMLKRAFLNTLSSAAMVMALVSTGLVFNWMIVTSGLIKYLSNSLLILENPIVVLLLLNMILLFMGCFIGSMQSLIMMTPLLLSLADGLGLSYIHIGVLAVFNLVIGLITPPMAPSLFVTCKATGVAFNKSLRYTLGFIIPLVVVLMIITFFPNTVLWLPRLLGAL